MTAGIEAARPAPWIFVEGNANALRDRPRVHVTIIDVPAFFAGIGRAAAREFGHTPSKRDPGAVSNPAARVHHRLFSFSAAASSLSRSLPHGLVDLLAVVPLVWREGHHRFVYLGIDHQNLKFNLMVSADCEPT
jgi:hypothetical protein